MKKYLPQILTKPTIKKRSYERLPPNFYLKLFMIFLLSRRVEGLKEYSKKPIQNSIDIKI